MSSPPSTCLSVRGPVERPIGAFADPGPQALVPLCGQFRIQGLCFEHSGHPGRDSRHLRRTFRRWSRPLTPRSRFPNDPPAAPRPAASSHYSRPAADSAILTRAPSCVSCARRAVSAVAADRSGSAFMLESGSVLLLGPSLRWFASWLGGWLILESPVGLLTWESCMLVPSWILRVRSLCR
jgi:hypothetical protein